MIPALLLWLNEQGELGHGLRTTCNMQLRTVPAQQSGGITAGR
jgi:hypothetical protein